MIASETMREARARYFQANGFGDGGYTEPWVMLALGPLKVWLPNSDSRKKVVPLHDLHHVVTGYATDVRGEGAIGAWEIAAGCKSAVAWFLNLGAAFLGTVLAPRATFAAFVRGRRCRSLYGDALEPLLERTVDEVRAQVGIVAADQDARPATFMDRLAFGAMVVAGGLAGVLGFALVVVATPVALVFSARARAQMKASRAQKT